MTNSTGKHLASYRCTAVGSRALAARLRDDHGKDIYTGPYQDHAALTAMHATAHENQTTAETRIRQDPDNGRVLVSAASPVGEITYDMAAETAERIRVTPVDAFTCRGRRYGGTVVLNRADFAPEWRDAWMLTDADRGLPADRAAYGAISAAVSWAVEAHVAAHPEVAAEGNRAAARLRASLIAGQIAEAEKELAMLRAEHARFLKAAGGEQ